ncbi:hypothetical protein RCA18_002621 [Salmonella enterica]|nr:hypothetical protein [Salmonella enterica]ELE8133539.1 hypothetical protein [Salmonella enterica]
MKKIYQVLLISALLSGCGYQYERTRDRESASTLQQKRDVLLKWTPFTISNRHPGDPSNVYEARRNYIGHGEESNEFLLGLISHCYNSTSDLCAYNYYVNARKVRDKKKYAEQIKISNENKQRSIGERNKKTPVRKGDLFYCKVAFNPAGERTDSGIRVGIKDNIDTVGFVFSNGYQFVSPKLKIVDEASGMRAGRTDDKTITVIAGYDGSNYSIDTYNTYILRQFSRGIIIDTEQTGHVGRIDAYDCQKG